MVGGLTHQNVSDMAFLTPEELQTHLYKENIETISREDDAIVAAAIDAAIEEASGYLGAYDRKKIFGAIQRYPLYGWSTQERQR